MATPRRPPRVGDRDFESRRHRHQYRRRAIGRETATGQSRTPCREDQGRADAAKIWEFSLFINARTDPFLLKFGSPDECLDEAARRAKIYADAGADGIFVPGLTDLALIEKFVQLPLLPVNIMVTQGVPEIPDLARVGVRRVSLGPWPMMAAMRVIGQAAASVAASKQYGTFLQPNG